VKLRKEGFNVFDFLGLGPILDDLDFVWGLMFAMGLLRVGICHTITIPSDTTPMKGKGRN